MVAAAELLGDARLNVTVTKNVLEDVVPLVVRSRAATAT